MNQPISDREEPPLLAHRLGRRQLVRTGDLMASAAAALAVATLARAQDDLVAESVFDVAVDGASARYVKATPGHPSGVPMIGDTFIFFVLEFNFSDDLQENIDHPFGIGAFGYGASVNYCMTTALAVGGEGTGTCLGERRFHALATEAGFSEVRLLDFPQNPFNLIFEVKA